MIKNYFKTAWRTMILNRTYSLTNLIGLTLGLLVIMLITTRVIDELSYDRQWKWSDALYRLETTHIGLDGNAQFRSPGAPTGLANVLMEEFPEIVDYANIHSENPKLAIDPLSDRQAELTVLASDTNFFNLFETQAIIGNPKQFVAHAKNLIITETTHQHYFGGKEVVGKTFYNMPEEGEPEPYLVTAVIADLPQNTHLYTEAIVITPHQQAFEPDKAGMQQGQYLRLQQNADTALMAKKINAWYAGLLSDKDYVDKAFAFQSIKDIHLLPKPGPNASDPKRDIYLLSGISLLILVLVCINFVNLTFAHAVKRTQETGIRKVLGATRKHLFAQMGIESLLLFGGALMLTLPAYMLSLPLFERYLGHPLTHTFQSSTTLLIGLLFFWLALGVLCSLFPAFALSKTEVSEGLRKRLSVLRLPLNLGFTRGLITLQFAIAMVVVVAMLTIRAQLDYIADKDLGYEPKNLLVMDFTEWEGKAQAFKQTLLQQPSIAAASFSFWTPFSGSANMHSVIDPENPEEEKTVVFVDVDFDFVQTLKMQLTDGRNLQPNYALDAVTYNPDTVQQERYTNVLITETMAKQLHLKLNEGSAPLGYTPVGIINDFHGASLRYEAAPFAIRAQRDWDAGCLIVRATEGKEKEALATLTSTWNTFFPNRISRINWLEDQVKNQYEKEQKQFQQLVFFSGISMLIALLGVLGIAIYTLERRVKEIGIRKVLGASAIAIVSLISSSFTKLVFIAMGIAFPIAWWLMHKWLEDFAYRIEMPIYLFALTGILTLLCMLAVVGFRTFRAARTNPVESLRDE